MCDRFDASPDEWIGKGMKFGPEVAHFDENTTTEERRAVYDAYAPYRQQQQAHIALFPLESNQRYTFSGNGLRDCGKKMPRLEGARPEMPIQPDGEYVLTLTNCIKGGTDCWAQVWLCQLEGPGIAHDTQVVLKLYQSSFFPMPGNRHFIFGTDEFGKDVEPPENYARREACAYARLASQQGSLVPYCYGFYQFTLPCGEVVEGVVMEYIRGVDGEQYIKLVKASEADRELKMSMLWSLYRRVFEICHLFINKYEVIHRDLRIHNLIIDSDGSFDASKMVIIDFNRSLTPDTIPLSSTLQAEAQSGHPLTEFSDSIEDRKLLTSKTRYNLMHAWRKQ